MTDSIRDAMKLHAKGLYLVVDIGGTRKYTFEHIAKELLRIFGEKVSPSTISRWSNPWEMQMEEARILAAEAASKSLYEHESDISPRKNVMDKLDKLQSCITTQMQLGIVANSKRFKHYLEREEELLKFISKPESDIDDDEAKKFKRLFRLLPLSQILAGIKQSNDMYHGYVDQLFKLEGLKKQSNILDAEATAVRDSEWEHEPVDILTFMESEDYLNLGKNLFDVVRQDLKEIFFGNPRTMKRLYREVVMKGSVGCGKCSSEATLCINSVTGKLQTIKELLDNNEKEFWSYGLNTDSWKIEKVKVTDIVHNGKRKLYKLTLDSGRSIEATNNHQFYGKTGWKELQYFENKDLIAIPRKLLDTNNSTSLTNDDIYFIGCMLSDGCLTKKSGYTFTKPSNVKLLYEIERILRLNMVPCSQYFYKGRIKEIGIGAYALDYFNRIGLSSQIGKYSYEKCIPDSIMALPNDKLKVFLNSAFNTDGCLQVDKNMGANKSPLVRMSFSSSSELLIHQMITLINRLGFVARLRSKIPKINGKLYRKHYELNLTGESAYKLLLLIGPMIGKEDKYEEALSIQSKLVFNTNTDVVPFGQKEIDVYYSKQTKYGYRAFNKKYSVKGPTLYSRSRLKKLRDDFNDPSLDKIIESDIFWDKVKSIEELPGTHNVYDLVVDSPCHNFVGNGMITHNSEAAAIVSSYLAYLVLCLRNPCEYFEFLPGSKIAIINISVNTKQAKNVVFGKIKAKIDNCKWFREHYMYDNRSKLELRFDPCDSTTITENRVYKNVYIIPGNSSEYSAVGYDILCAIIDEATLYPRVDDRDQAQVIYDVLRERVISRFNDKGLIVMLGNPMHTEDFLEKRIKSGLHEKGTYCVPERSIWDSKYPNWDGEVFYFDRYKLVEVDEKRKHDPDIITIPQLYRDNFIANPEQSARGLGGWSLESISRYLKNSENIDRMFSKRINPVKSIDEINCTVEFHEWFKPVSNGWHAIHLDLGTVSDAAGICLGHMYDYIEGKPYFMVDAILRIKGSKTNPVIFEKIRDIVYQFQALHFQIKCVTMDGYQSTDTIQILRAKGFNAELLSVDKTMLPYGNLKNAINEQRITSPYDKVLDKELRNLEDVDGKRVDHPFRGSKDEADAVCGMVNCCMEYIPRASVTPSNAVKVEVKKVTDKEEVTPEQFFEKKLNNMAGS